MKKQYSYTRPSQVSKMDFDDLFEEISSGWEEKARRLQARRWRELRRAMRGDYNDYAT